MSSINFNAAASSALRTLQNTNSALDATQSRISTGLKIGEAKDNAAYWSISTTLKSDNKAMGTVKDALGLGAATVDTAYQGLNQTLNVLNDIKAKITASTQDGVDRNAVQAEINELQKQLVAIASSSSFSKENWLSVDSSATGYTADRAVVSSFIRDASNGVSIGTIGIDISTVALFDSSATGEGILNAGKFGNDTKLGQIASGKEVSTATSAASAGTVAFTAGATNVTTESLSVDITVDNGQTKTVTFTSGATQAATATAFANAVTAAFGSAVTVDDTGTGGVVNLESATEGASSRIVVANIRNTTTGGTTTLTNTTPVPGEAAVYDKASLDFATFATADAFTLDADDTISFQLMVDKSAAATITIRKSTIDLALGTTDGKVNDSVAMRNVLAQAISDAKVGGLAVTEAAGVITLESNAATADSKIEIYGVAASKGTAVTDINVVGASKTLLADYISTINTAIDKVTSAAANLGAVAARIDIQKSFVENLMDTIDKGVSGLVDADMNEESTKLQALQVKQQLGVQALSIANQSAQNVLRLFQ